MSNSCVPVAYLGVQKLCTLCVVKKHINGKIHPNLSYLSLIFVIEKHILSAYILSNKINDINNVINIEIINVFFSSR